MVVQTPKRDYKAFGKIDFNNNNNNNQLATGKNQVTNLISYAIISIGIVWKSMPNHPVY